MTQTAFQVDAFQNDAFQIVADVVALPQTGGAMKAGSGRWRRVDDAGDGIVRLRALPLVARAAELGQPELVARGLEAAALAGPACVLSAPSLRLAFAAGSLSCPALHLPTLSLRVVHHLAAETSAQKPARPDDVFEILALLDMMDRAA